MTKDIEKTLFAAADKMRGKMDPGEYKYVALRGGLLAGGCSGMSL